MCTQANYSLKNTSKPKINSNEQVKKESFDFESFSKGVTSKNKYLVNFKGGFFSTNGAGVNLKLRGLEPETLERIYFSADKTENEENNTLKAQIYNELNLKASASHGYEKIKVLTALENLKALQAAKESINAQDVNEKMKAVDIMGDLVANIQDENFQAGVFRQLTAEGQGINDENPRVKEKSFEALNSLGTNANDALKGKMFKQLTAEEQGINNRDSYTKGLSFLALGYLGVNAKDTLQSAIYKKLTIRGQGINDSNSDYVKAQSFLALGDLGANVKDKHLQGKIFDNLKKSIKNKNTNVRSCASAGVKNMVNDIANLAEEKQNELFNILTNERDRGINDTNKVVKADSFTILGYLGVNAEEEKQGRIYNKLKNGIKDTDDSIKIETILAAGNLGVSAKGDKLRSDIFDDLKNAISSEQESIRVLPHIFLEDMLSNINYANKKNELFDLLTDKNNQGIGIKDQSEEVKQLSLRTLGKLGVKAKNRELARNIFAALEREVNREDISPNLYSEALIAKKEMEAKNEEVRIF